MAWTFNKPVFRPSDIPTNLVGYWKFTEATGADRLDSSGNSRTLTDVGGDCAAVATDYWKSGENSADLEATTTANYFTGGDILDMNAKSMSISMWLKPETAGLAYLVSKGTPGTNGFHLYMAATAQVELYLHDINSASGTALVAGKWQHLAVTYNNSTTVVCFYVNGNLVYSATNAGVVTDINDVFTVGSRSSSPPNANYDGMMKDLAIWEAALTPLQIKSLALGVDLSKYAYRPNHVSTQPTHWWKLNEVSGNRADSIGAATLTDTNTVLSSGGYVEGVGADFEVGTSEYFTTAYSSDWAFGTGDFTIRMRCKFESFATGTAISLISTKRTEGGFQLENQAGAQPSAWRVYLGGTLTTFTANTTLSGVWYDFCLKRASGTVSLFIDGIDVGGSAENTGDVNSNDALFVGASEVDNYYMDGVMEDVAIWKGYAITDAEIKSLACALPIQRQGIVSYWKLNEAADATRADSIGTNTLTEKDGASITTGTGKVGNAVDLEAGDTAWLEAPNSDSLDIVSDMAILGWHKPEAIDITQTLVDKDYAGDGYGIRVDTGEKYLFYVGNDSDTSTSSVAAGTFSHFCGNYDGALKAVYFNGVLEGSGAYATNPADTTVAFRVGSTIAGGDYADGLLDELVLTKRYFRPEEIKAAYLKGLNGKEVTTVERPIGNNSQIIWVS